MFVRLLVLMTFFFSLHANAQSAERKRGLEIRDCVVQAQNAVQHRIDVIMANAETGHLVPSEATGDLEEQLRDWQSIPDECTKIIDGYYTKEEEKRFYFRIYRTRGGSERTSDGG